MVTATHTHVGWLGVRAHESFESYWHGDGPRAKASHACNETAPGSGRYRSLCGRAIVPGDGRDMLPAGAGDVTRVIPAGSARVTCKGCRKRIGARPLPDAPPHPGAPT